MTNTISVVSPTTQKVLFEIPCLTSEQIDQKVQQANAAFPSWKKEGVEKRVKLMERFLELFAEKKEQVAESIASQMGRPKRYGAGEINGVVERASYMISVAQESLKDDIIEDKPQVKRFLRKEPLGVVFIIAAWNYPYLTIGKGPESEPFCDKVNNLIPALLVGNCVLLKQSPQTPKCADIFVETLHEAGVPKDVVQVVHVDDQGANTLVQHPGIQFVNFTGSVAVGKKIRQSIGDSQRLIGSAMELGGKDPAYVLPDANIDYAVENIVDGAFFNSGQCCCSIERCYVHADVYDAFIEKAVTLTQKYVLGDPNDDNVTLGPMANIRFAENVRSQLNDAVEKGAKLLIDTEKYFPLDKPGTSFVGPQILINVDHSMTIMKEETFGPVLGIMRVESDDEAIQLMNDSNYGLTASIWTSNPDKAIEIGDRIETGTWFMNRCDYIDPALAWVGAKESGLGFSMSKQGFSQFFRWMSERYPMCSQLITENRIPEFDNLYLDMNGIIHNCSHNNNESAHFRISEEQIWIGIFNYVDHLFAKIKPKKTFFLAIDGVAPRAKMNQQRSRRFRTAKDAEDARRRAISKGEELPEEDPFDSNCITPGTAFMKKLTMQLRYFISKKVSEDSLWRDVEIILSGPEVPGEGEHKIMEYIRLSKAQPDYNPNTRHCLYGLDADLVMLGLLSHDPHFALLREEVTFGGKKSRHKSVSLESQNFYLMHLSLLREYLDKEFRSLDGVLSFDYNLERILDDFILLALFVGNDFLPNLPNLHINEGALGLMFNIYKKVLPNCDSYIQDAGRVNLTNMQLVLNELAQTVEKEAFEAELVDSLYIGGKQQADFEEMHRLEKKQRKKKELVLTPTQRDIFEKLKEFVLAHKPGKSEALHFPPDLKAVDRRFVEMVSDDLGLEAAIEYSNEDDSKHVYVEINESDESDESEETEDEVDEEAIAARDRVFNKYDNAPVVAELSAEEIEQQEKDKADQKFKQWRADYYMEKMNIDIDNEKEMDALIGSYITGIQWVLHYYYDGVVSWGWFYPYHYAPKISDLVNISKYQDIQFELGQPFKPYEQLMGVLPALSKKLLPPAYQELMTDPSSPIIDFYPRDFDLDMNGKKQDWEAVVKIPFIDEKRLLEAMARKEGQLTKFEREIARFGDSFKFVYEAIPEDDDEASKHVYPSPLPGVFPDIHHCCARQVLYHLPTLDNNITLRKTLLSGAKYGKESLAGFPTLATIPHSSTLSFHNVKVFQQDSKNETVVVKLHDRFANMKTDEIAKLLLYKRVFVHYPYLQEAVVIAVSNETTKYTLKIANKKRIVRETPLDEEGQKDWSKLTGRAEYLSSKRFGLEIGTTVTALHVCVLRGMKRTEEGALIKEYVSPAQEEVVPVQAAVMKVVNEDPRTKEHKAPPVSIGYPINSKIFLLGGGGRYGTMGTITGHSQNNLDIQMVVPVLSPRELTQPTFGIEARSHQDQVSQYMSSFVLAEAVKINALTLSKITSSLQIMDRNAQKVNVGLSLKFEARQQKVIGYTRKNGAGHWEYSSKAAALIKDYVTTFPEFIVLVQGGKNGGFGGMLNASDFAWTENGSAEIKRMRQWLKERGVDSLPTAPLSAEEFEEPVIKVMEKAAEEYHTYWENLDFKRVLVKNTPRTVLLRPEDAATKLHDQIFQLGDRVTYVLESGAVPIDSKGTVVGVQEKAVEIVFDTPFMGGQDLSGRCSEYRGLVLPFYAVLNLTVPQFAFEPMGQRPTHSSNKENRQTPYQQKQQQQQQQHKQYRGHGQDGQQQIQPQRIMKKANGPTSSRD
ncbi:exoribonuclease 1 [Halteromyces radiatus]|uniref:exoribonuclease 1 n=1 Tax=Halteromyces radiatus TaxID=101107 RepID=UPI00221F38A1|nr:exoribonuclease 1 [Halteromyces radiatus]KAI8099060.1 exoribonuclease 1 [Halteromyces radiatus]